jgi:20S proteasome subunit alpha 6
MGVGLLVAGYDEDGAHIFQTCPSANYYDCKAMSIGSRSQSARTYLEKHLDSFKGSTLNELVRHGLLALRECLPNDLELNDKNLSIAIVGKDRKLTVYDDDTIQQWLDLITPEERKGRSTALSTPSVIEGTSTGGDQSRPDDNSREPRPRTPETEDHMAVD